MTKSEFNQMVMNRGSITVTAYYTNQHGETPHINYNYNPFAVEKSIAVSRALAKLKKFAKSRGEKIVSFIIHIENEFDY